MSHRFADLRALSDAELVAEHDRRATNTVVGTAYFVDELNRRAQDREAQGVRELAVASHRLSVRSFWLSVATAVASLIAIAVSVVTLIVTASAFD